MKKYCVVEVKEDGTKEKVSRFFNTEAQAKLRVRNRNHSILTKVSCIEQGLFTVPKRKPIQKHIDVSLVKGLHMDDKYTFEYAQKVNQQRYIRFCIKEGFLIPKLTTVL